MPDLPDATYLTDFHAYRAEHDPDGRCWTYLERTWTWGEACRALGRRSTVC